ncbi:MAG TPA: HD domain-containing protein [Candidatus Scybalousia intestinigallinarum]|nr:HD domain-containing protein [Candidatus Scybalousia intestinigallinarum]
MNFLNEQLTEYVENKIFPIYDKNEAGHGIEHIEYVIRRSLEFARQFDHIDLNMVYVIAAFHDLAHHIDKDNHEVLSAKLFYENETMKKFFTDEQRQIIKEAIEDHRASLEYEPRSNYGKIVSSADRYIDIISSLKSTHSYIVKHYPDLDLNQMIDHAYRHISKKFGPEGYAKSYCYDKEFEEFKKAVEELLEDKYEFAVKYMEVNGIMDIKEKAKLFAIQAHMGQVRKSEPDKPMIIHPIGVGQLLESFGYDDNIVAAGYLHDVVEDTKYTIHDIEKEFGKDVANLVMGASEADKSLPWEERKKHTIEEVKKLPLRNKLVVCADKINNLEDLFLKFEKSGERDFSAFKRGEEQQKWYYTSIYESLITGENKDLPIFERLKDILDKVFYKKEDTYLRDTIFMDNKDYYAKLKQLHAMKVELQRLKSLCSLPKPFVIEFSGTPRTGKTTTINNLYDFFKKGGFNTTIIEEFTTSKYYKEVFKKRYKDVNSTESNIAIIEEVTKQLEDALNSDREIILIDRSINDRQIWNYRRYVRGEMPEEQYQEVKEKYRSISKKLIDFLVITYAEPLTSLRRDYDSSLALEKRNFLNLDNLNEYNNRLKDLEGLLETSVEDSILLDTTSMSMNDVSVEIASQIMPAMRKKYIKSFQQKYDLK